MVGASSGGSRRPACTQANLDYQRCHNIEKYGSSTQFMTAPGEIEKAVITTKPRFQATTYKREQHDVTK